MEARQWTGDWWIPPDHDRQVAGTLRFDPDGGLALDLFGSLDDSDPLTRLNAPLRREVAIHGVTHGGVEVTLLDAWVMSQSANFSRWQTEKESWSARRALLGVHASTESMKGNTLTASFNGMRSWAGRAPFERIGEPGTPGFRWGSPPDHLAALGHMTVSVRHTAGVETDLDSATLRDTLSIQVALAEDASLDSILSYLQPLRSLASFLLDEATFFQYVGVRGSDEMAGYRLGPNAGDRRMELAPIEVLFDQVGRRAPERRDRPLFTLADSPVPFEQLIERWLAISAESEIGSVLAQYFGLAYAPPEFSEVRFAVLVNALEEYHRRRIGGTSLPPEEFTDLQTWILEALSDASRVSGKERKWLKGKFKRLNDLSLESRIRGLVETHVDALSSLIGDPQGFSKRVADTRNFISHGEPEIEDRAASGVEVYYLGQCLRQLFVALLLAEIGADGRAIGEILSRNDRHNWLVEGTRDFGWAERP